METSATGDACFTVYAPPKGEWIASHKRQFGCPPGLEYLTAVNQLFIHQQVELLQVFTGWDKANKYAIKNTAGQQIYFAAEESNFWARQCLCHQRPFELHIMDFSNTEVLRICRPFKCACFGNWSPLLSCSRLELEVQAPVGTTIGFFRQDCSCVAPAFSVSDAQDQVKLLVKGPMCVFDSPCFPFDQEFLVYGDGGEQVGKISKRYSGFMKELFTVADNFNVSFDVNMDPKLKATLLGAVFLIDFMYFEK